MFDRVEGGEEFNLRSLSALLVARLRLRSSSLEPDSVEPPAPVAVSLGSEKKLKKKIIKKIIS